MQSLKTSLYGVMKAVAIGIASVLCMPANNSSAATFDFSYKFDTGDIISGSFTGTQSGQNVTNIAKINASLNGTAFTGRLSALSYTDAGSYCNSVSCFATTGAVVSFDPSQNTFCSWMQTAPRISLRQRTLTFST